MAEAWHPPLIRTRIDIHDPQELAHWTQRLGVTREQLKAAVAKVGVDLDEIKQELARIVAKR